MNCNVCNGELVYMGTLGNREHYRCRQCGAECSFVFRIRPKWTPCWTKHSETTMCNPDVLALYKGLSEQREQALGLLAQQLSERPCIGRDTCPAKSYCAGPTPAQCTKAWVDWSMELGYKRAHG